MRQEKDERDYAISWSRVCDTTQAILMFYACLDGDIYIIILMIDLHTHYEPTLLDLRRHEH